MKIERERKMIRLIIVVLFVFLFLIISLPVLFIVRIIGHFNPQLASIASYHIIQWAFQIVRYLSGVKLIVKGKENLLPHTAVLYVGNHRSYFDIVLSYLCFPAPTGFVAKKEMFKVFILRRWMENIHCLFLDRKDIKQGLKTILKGIEQIKSGISVCIFPEGTRNKNDDELLPFKAGSLKIAEKSGCPIIPMAINHSDDVLEKHLPFIKKTTVIIEFGKAVPVANLDKEEKKLFAKTIQNTVKTMYDANKTLPN